MEAVGIHLDPSLRRICQLSKSKKGVQILFLKTESLHCDFTKEPSKDDASPNAPASNVKPLYMKNSASVLPALSCFMRRYPLNVKGKHLEKALRFQAEAQSHLPEGEALHVPLVYDAARAQDALVFSFPKEAMRRHLSRIDSDSVSAIPLALTHFFAWKMGEADLFVLDIGSYETCAVWTQGGKLHKAHAIAIGVETLITSLYEDRKKILLKTEIESAAKQIDLLLLKPDFNPHLTRSLSALRTEARKVFYSFFGDAKKKIVVTGRTDAFIHLKEYLFEEVESSLSQEEERYAVAIGCAIEKLSSQPLQLRREEFFPKRTWKKLGFYAFFLTILSLLLSISIVFATQRFVESRIASMKETFAVEGSLETWISSIEKQTKDYPYILKAPKVAYCLQNLTPLLKSVELKDFSYKLLQYPSFSSPEEEALARVELHFSSEKPVIARNVYDAIQSASWVDSEKEITWEALSDSYRISFYLKNGAGHV